MNDVRPVREQQCHKITVVFPARIENAVRINGTHADHSRSRDSRLSMQCANGPQHKHALSK